MKTLKKILLLTAGICACLFAGCASRGSGAVTADDFKNAALSCLDQMYKDGVLDTLEDTPTIKVTRVLNRTSYLIQTGMITDRIISELNRSGKVRAMSEDAYMLEKKKWTDAMNSEDGLDTPPDFADITLSGKIYEEGHRVGNYTEKTYLFRLELNKDGLVLGGPWLYEVTKSR